MAGSLFLGGAAAHADKSGGTLSFLVQPEPPTLASYVSTSGPIGLVMPKVYEGLFDYNNDGTMVPILAESYSASADGKTVTFNLRKGVKWHDGKPFTSADVQFTVMEVLKKVHPRGPNSFREHVHPCRHALTQPACRLPQPDINDLNQRYSVRLCAKFKRVSMEVPVGRHIA